jgi:hypothetical protein
MAVTKTENTDVLCLLEFILFILFIFILVRAVIIIVIQKKPYPGVEDQKVPAANPKYKDEKNS